jgi:hypothetical protein
VVGPARSAIRSATATSRLSAYKFMCRVRYT